MKIKIIPIAKEHNIAIVFFPFICEAIYNSFALASSDVNAYYANESPKKKTGWQALSIPYQHENIVTFERNTPYETLMHDTNGLQSKPLYAQVNYIIWNKKGQAVRSSFFEES